MAQILKSNQGKYVPTSKINGKAKVLVPVAQHGDQLFDERGRNVQWAFGDGANQYDRLEGLRTEFADWHAKFTLYKVIFTYSESKNIFYTWYSTLPTCFIMNIPDCIFIICELVQR